MEFDSDGKPIMPDWVKKEIGEIKKFILITREQVSARQPAVARVVFEIGEELNHDKNGNPVNKAELLIKMKNFLKRTASSFQKDFPGYSIIVGERKIILEARETKFMYSFLEWVEEEFRRTYENIYPLQKKGLYKLF